MFLGVVRRKKESPKTLYGVLIQRQKKILLAASLVKNEKSIFFWSKRHASSSSHFAKTKSIVRVEKTTFHFVSSLLVFIWDLHHSLKHFVLEEKDAQTPDEMRKTKTKRLL